jgi:hypothetical protein
VAGSTAGAQIGYAVLDTDWPSQHAVVQRRCDSADAVAAAAAAALAAALTGEQWVVDSCCCCL